MVDNIEPIVCTFTNETSLYLAFMPFVKGGGLFIRTLQLLPLETEVELAVQLLTDPDPYQITGKVIWVTPKGAQGNKPAGIGVQFIGEQSSVITNRIETLLAGMLKSSQLTDTM